MSSAPLTLPGVRQKVIGLVSGGKDSCFNLVHCAANGHELVAIATLQPEEGIGACISAPRESQLTADELDSHLYQSVGTQLLPLIAESMGVPLFVGIIKGKAVEQGPEYGDRTQTGDGTSGDETEDLTKLLRRVQVSMQGTLGNVINSRKRILTQRRSLPAPYCLITSAYA